MDVAVERLDVVFIDKDSLLHHGCDGRRSQFSLAVGQRAVRHPAVDAGRAVDARKFHQRVGKHRFHILIDGSFRVIGLTFLVSKEEAVVGHHVFQDVVFHKHVERVVGIRVVGSRAHFDAVVAEIVVPSAFRLGAVAIDFCGEGCEVVEVVDAVGFQHFVGLGEDGVANLTRSGFILFSIWIPARCKNL